MANNVKLTPELEAAFKKANMNDEDIRKIMEGADVQKIGLDDLDGISGGGNYAWGNETPPEDWQNPVFNGMTLAEGRAMINALYDQFGADITVSFCMEAFNFKTNAWEESMRAGGPNYCADVMWGICWKHRGK